MGKWGKRALIGAGVLGVIGVAGSQTEYGKFLLKMPHDRNVLFWPAETRDAAFRHLEWIPVLKYHTMAHGDAVHNFAQGTPLAIGPINGTTPLDLDKFMADQRAVGALVIVDGKIRLEKYAMGYTPTDRWTSFSVAKSYTSTLIGAAIKDGYIKSVDQPVTDIIPEFKGTAYDGVTIRQILTMTSGVKWIENYSDPKSDVAQFDLQKPEGNEEPIVTYLKKLPREAAPGTKWVYKTGETNLIGVIVMRATKRSLADYLTEKVWKPAGMAEDGFWVLDHGGKEIGGCCISSSLSDYARFGQFIMGGAQSGGKSILPDGWIAAATSKQEAIEKPGRGYGYQWWTYDDGSFAAQGHFGQTVFVDPKRKIVVAINADYASSIDHGEHEQRNDFIRAVQKAVDTEQHVNGRAIIQ